MKHLICSVILIVFSLQLTYSQESEKGGSTKNNLTPTQHKVQPRFLRNTYRSYRLTENTKVWRKYSDSTTKEFTRDCIYYMTIRVPDAPEEGFQKVIITVDSLQYNFIDDTLKFDYFTQDEKKRPPNFFDFEATAVPLNRQFTMTYSPYGDVAKIESDDIQSLKDYMAEQGPKLKKKDEMKNFIWNDGISDNRLKYLTDIKKIIFPDYSLPLDSIWKTPIFIQIDFKDYYDTLQAKIIDYNSGNYTIEAISQNLRPVNKECYFYNIPQTGYVDSSKGGGLLRITMNPRGIITKVTGDFNLQNNAAILNEKFIEKVNVKMAWDFLGQFAM